MLAPVSTVFRKSDGTITSAKNIGYSYNADGSRASMTTPAGTFSYAHDTRGNWTGLQDHTGNITNWNYDALSRMSRQTMANGVQTNFTYNALSQMVGLTHIGNNGLLLSKFGHESDPAQMLLRDAAGNLKREVVTHAVGAFSGTTNYSYDNKDQLTQESSTRNNGFSNAFGYDAMGNPTSWKGQARTFNLNNQETTGGSSQFSYDGNGNPTTYKGSAFAFNENDKLTRITTAGSVVLQAGYRSDGLRAWKNTSNGTTYFLYDGDQLVCEFDGNGTLKNSNIWGANGLLARQSGSVLTNFVWDDRGNIAQQLSSNGTVATNFNVTSWGDVTRDTSSNDAYFGLGGQFGNYFDVETGLLLCGQRYYDSGAGRWLTRDPISYAGGLNVYGYVGNNPTNFVDPEGEQARRRGPNNTWYRSDMDEQPYPDMHIWHNGKETNISYKGGFNRGIHHGHELVALPKKLREAYKGIINGFLKDCRRRLNTGKKGGKRTRPKPKPRGSRTVPNPRRGVTGGRIRRGIGVAPRGPSVGRGGPSMGGIGGTGGPPVVGSGRIIVGSGGSYEAIPGRTPENNNDAL